MKKPTIQKRFAAELVLPLFVFSLGTVPLFAAATSSAAPADDYARQKVKPTDGIPMALEGPGKNTVVMVPEAFAHGTLPFALKCTR